MNTPPNSNNQSEQGLTQTHVIIIACVCAVIIITLLTILICFIFRRKRNQAKEYEAETSTRQSQPVNGSVANQQKSPQGYDNADNSKAGRPGELQFQGIPRSPTKDKYMEEDRKDGSLQSGQESGYSTPDPNKPKKVIYEVVV